MSFASPLAQSIWDAMIRHGVGEQHRVPLSGFHVDAKLDVDEFERGLGWLIHFCYVEKVVEHGTVYMQHPFKEDKGPKEYTQLEAREIVNEFHRRFPPPKSLSDWPCPDCGSFDHFECAGVIEK